ncbi:2'-5' RNA ligase family protein [Saccharicrinis sp. FJH62]|uniref:2'-5' RNA ligase family protein n=1 Tax=Saccharicrinis sp. FJH62 TaxID=3344657 RepID=UPI0035D4B83E
MNLYFIAVIPDEILMEKVKNMKREIQQRFNAKHALKSPAHITLQMPFKRNEEFEHELEEVLKNFATKQSSFKLHLKNLGCFKPRVIYIDVENPSPLQHLHAGLKKQLITKLSFDQKEVTQNVTPHMTLATRDLDAKEFYKAWPEYEKRTFNAEFNIESIFLLKHNGKFWDIYREFVFQL